MESYEFAEIARALIFGLVKGCSEHLSVPKGLERGAKAQIDLIDKT